MSKEKRMPLPEQIRGENEEIIKYLLEAADMLEESVKQGYVVLPEEHEIGRQQLFAVIAAAKVVVWTNKIKCEGTRIRVIDAVSNALACDLQDIAVISGGAVVLPIEGQVAMLDMMKEELQKEQQKRDKEENKS